MLLLDHWFFLSLSLSPFFPLSIKWEEKTIFHTKSITQSTHRAVLISSCPSGSQVVRSTDSLSLPLQLTSFWSSSRPTLSSSLNHTDINLYRHSLQRVSKFKHLTLTCLSSFQVCLSPPLSLCTRLHIVRIRAFLVAQREHYKYLRKINIFVKCLEKSFHFLISYRFGVLVFFPLRISVLLQQLFCCPL